jgi:hypothetical protein
MAAFVAAGCLSVLSIAAWLTPSTEGHGTHRALGLPECSLVTIFDTPCPTCGMTTAFSHAADGSYLTALTTQPLGAVLAATCAAVFWMVLHTAVFGSRLGVLAASLLGGKLLLVGGAALVAAWVYKIITW